MQLCSFFASIHIVSLISSGSRGYYEDVSHWRAKAKLWGCDATGGKDQPGQQKARLLDIFGHWCDAVTDLIRATPEADVMRRDIFDRPPIFTWTRGRVALLGDSAHAMQPNLGQARTALALYCVRGFTQAEGAA